MNDEYTYYDDSYWDRTENYGGGCFQAIALILALIIVAGFLLLVL